MSVDVFGKQQGDTNLETEQAIADIERRLGVSKTLEAVASSILELPIAPTPGSYFGSFTHNLGYAPSFMAFWLFGSSYQQVPSYWFTSAGALAMSLVASSNAATFDLEFFYRAAATAGFPASPLKVKFYLFREPSQ